MSTPTEYRLEKARRQAAEARLDAIKRVLRALAAEGCIMRSKDQTQGRVWLEINSVDYVPQEDAQVLFELLESTK